MSRTAGQLLLFGEVEKEHMRALIRRVEGFTGVHVLTYAVMSNHVHLLLEEPDRDEVVSDDVFRCRMACFYSDDELAALYEMWSMWDDASVEADRLRYVRRMHDISEFMKQVKQRFARWYNRVHQRKGTLWDDRFKSVWVEEGTPLRVVSAYIEMNPVRAGMVTEPQHYKYCGFGEAMRGLATAQRGIRKLVMTMEAALREWNDVSTFYLERILMYDEVRRHPERACTDHDYLRKKLGARLKLTDFERLMCRCRYFTDGRVVGGEAFVEAFFEENRDAFGSKRTCGSRKFKGGWNHLYAVRELVDW